MKRLRAAVDTVEKWANLKSYLDLIDDNRTSDPGVALDGAKSLVESVAKTLLVDRGISYIGDESLGKLVKMAVRALPAFAQLEARDQGEVIKMLAGLESVASSAGALRNSHGLIGHGRDVHALNTLDDRLAALAIDCAEDLALFLIAEHKASPDGVTRLRYEEQSHFNSYVDDSTEELPVVLDIELLPSRALFSADPEAYKEKLALFTTENKEIISGLEQSPDFITTRALADRANDRQQYFTDEEVCRIARAIIDNPQIYRLIGSGYTGTMFDWVSTSTETLGEELVNGLKEAYKKKIY